MDAIEETAELMTGASGHGIAVQVDHLDPEQVQALARRVDDEHGRLDVLVNDVWGGELLTEWNVPVWRHDLDRGLRLLRLAPDLGVGVVGHAKLLCKNRTDCSVLYSRRE
jgi:NAD(P)-dependent dehydrogenase (short-subunit alcohol dehydrogenase family)